MPSPAGVQSANNLYTDEIWLTLITLSQGDWTLRLVNNYEAVTRLGEVYEPFSFKVALPDEEAQGVPVLEWSADNVDRRLVEALRQVTGAVDAEVTWVLQSQPDVAERGPLTLEMYAASYDAFTISGTLGVEPVLDRACGYKTMTPGATPGLF